MTRLAKIAVERGWARFDFWVLHWNPARGFYHRLGFEHLDEWLPYRAEGEALRRLAAQDVQTIELPEYRNAVVRKHLSIVTM
jgi:hypothetical protein